MRKMNHRTEPESGQNCWRELLVNVGRRGKEDQVTEKLIHYPEESEFILEPSNTEDNLARNDVIVQFRSLILQLTGRRLESRRLTYF